MLKLILGRAGSGKTTAVIGRICRAGQERPQLLLVPEPQSHETERALCAAGGDGISLYAEVLSFRRLGDRVLSQLGGIAAPELDGGGRILLMHRAVKESLPALTVYARPSRRPAFLKALLATADELKSCQVLPEQLLKAGEETAGSDGEKLHDLGLILSAYDGLTGQIALDPRDRLTRAAEKLTGSGWAAGKDVWLDGFTDFTPQELAVLRPLLRQSGSVTVTLTCDKQEEDEDGTGIFSPARRTSARLLRLAREEGVGTEVEHLTAPAGVRAPGLEAVEAHLFGPLPLAPVPCGGAVELFAALSPRSEVEWTAARIRALVQSGQYRYRDIGVAARCYGSYRELVETVFPQYGVPVFSAAMSDILEKPVLAMVTAALDTVSGGYRCEDLFRCLKTGLTNLPEDDRDVLENYALKWDLRGGKWTQERPWTFHPRGYGLPWTAEDEALLARVDKLRRQVAEPLEQLRRGADRTGAGRAMALYRFLERVGLPEKLEQRASRLEEQGQAALAEEYRQLWEILCGGLDQCAQLCGEEELELEEFSRLFRLVLSQYDVGTIPVSLDRVSAGETTRQTGHRVKVLFLLGADDASLPQTGTAPGLLSEDDRTLLSSYGLELGPNGRDLLYREMTTIYQTCARPTEKLILTWPAQGEGGEERRASFVAERLRLLFSDLTPVREESLNGAFRRTAPLPALEQAGRDPALRRALASLPEYAGQAQRVEQAERWQRGSLSRPVVDRLYGQKVSMSASRMDKYKSCHFSYFMRYGLQAEPRKPAGFSAPEYGTFVHYVLEHVLRDNAQLLDAPQWGETERAALNSAVDAAVERYVREELGGLEQQSDRFLYLFRRLLRPVRAVAANAVEELRSSSFRPISFELGFAKNGPLAPVEFTVDGITLSISGFVDRVDGWVKDGKLYLRVVDYKTGRKSFDLTEVFHGLGLQMLLYLFTLKDRGEKFYGAPVEGAGVFYLPARDVIVRGSRDMSDAAWQKAVDKELVRKGLVLSDPAVLAAMEHPGEDGFRFLPLKVSKTSGAVTGDALVSAERLGRLGGHIQRVLEEICHELAGGSIAADPFWRGEQKNACLYCDYAAACQFEEGRGGDCRRWLTKLDSGAFWQKIEEEQREEESGHALPAD